MPIDDAVRECVARLLSAEAGVQEMTLAPLGGGGNNRLFEIKLPGRRLVAKQYFGSSADRRDRLGAEWEFLAFAHRMGVDCVPRPVRCDRAARIAVMEHLDGTRIGSGDVDEDAIGQACEFFLRLNGPRRDALGSRLPEASEACFSIDDQCRLVAARVARLRGIMAPDDAGRAASRLGEEIGRRFARIECRLRVAAASHGGGLVEPVTGADRCISPSDFGFHNALRDDAGRFRFLDFEYAGWDDPAKLVSDFFCHPAVPVAARHLEPFLERCFAFTPRAQGLEARTRLLLPLFRLKWCCIMLNAFVREDGVRRRFANPATASAEWRRHQVEKVDAYLEHV